jgi:ribosomal-protein-serine acetyltransferase
MLYASLRRMERAIDRAVLIRPFAAADAPGLFTAAHESLATVGAWLPWCRPDYSLADCNAWIALAQNRWHDGIEYAFAIVDARTDALLGSVGINNINRVSNLASLGYWVRASAEGQGVATAAVKLAIRYAFGQLGLTRLEIVTRVNNTGSRRVAENVRAKFECIARNRIFASGRPHDAAVYSVIPGDET